MDWEVGSFARTDPPTYRSWCDDGAAYHDLFCSPTEAFGFELQSPGFSVKRNGHVLDTHKCPLSLVETPRDKCLTL
jgi:hypothetical protein